MIDDSSFHLRVHRITPDPEWDEFLEAATCGTYQQSSLWARVKATVGWRAVRLLLYQQGRIAGGAQLLIRPLPIVGAVAYVPRGPVMTTPEKAPLEALLSGLKDLAAGERILYMKLQPPPGGQGVLAALEAGGFLKSELEIAPRATTRVDLRRRPEALFRAMHTNARRNIAKARHLGVTVREGSGADLRLFAGLVEETGDRQDFSPYPPPYYEQMWQSFAARGRVRLLIAEHEGNVLASNLLIAFGNSVTYKMGAWSGTRKNVPPNELLHWTGMEWARQAGYSYYDLDDLKLSVAEAMVRGDASVQPRGLERFKLGLGGEVVVFPGPYDYMVRPLLGGALRLLAPQAERFRPLVDRVLGRGVSPSPPRPR